MLRSIDSSLHWVPYARLNLQEPMSILNDPRLQNIKQVAASKDAVNIPDTKTQFIVYLLIVFDHLLPQEFKFQMYVGKAARGLDDRWCVDGKSHMSVIHGLLRMASDDPGSLALDTRAKATELKVRLGQKEDAKSQRSPQLAEALLALCYNGATFDNCALFAIGKIKTDCKTDGDPDSGKVKTDSDPKLQDLKLQELEDDIIEALHTKDMRYGMNNS